MRSLSASTWLAAGMLLLLAPAPAAAQDTDQIGVLIQERLIEVDREKRHVRVRCEALRVDLPLEFFCVLRGTADHEAVLRTRAQPSAIHAALVGLGLEPGSPLRFLPERKAWLAPHGPPLRIEVEWEQDGRTIRRRAGELVRHIETKQPMPERPFVFAGSRTVDGTYGADATGQVVSLVNFEFSMIDVPSLASNANETLEWETNPDTAPPEGTEVWMILIPVAAPAPEGDAAEPEALEGPANVVVVALGGDGEVTVNNEPVALAEAGAAVRARSLPEAEGAGAKVRLTAARGAPIEDLGRLLAKLVEAGITDVRFIPPPQAREARREQARDGNQQPQRQAGGARSEPQRLEVAVHDGGREVTHGDRRRPLGQFIQEMQEIAGAGGEGAQGRYLVAGAPDAQDLTPVDVAAVHAALYVLGFEVEARYPGESAAALTGDRDPRFAELRQRWEDQVLPQSPALRQAAQTHYEVMEAYQREINRLLDEAERLRREMDELQARYNALTTPQP